MPGGDAMRFLVLGAGAMGGLFGGRLLKSGADVTFLVRPRRAAQLANDGLVVRTQDGEIRTSVQTAQAGGIASPYDVVLLSCKAYDLDSAMEAIAPAVGPDTSVLPLLNGVGHIDRLVERFGAGHVLGGVTTINAAMLSDGTIQQSQLRGILNAIGELDGQKSERCLAIKAALDAAGIPVDVSDNIRALMWLKFFGFACNATIASLMRSRAGAIARSPSGPAFVSSVIEECTRVLTAEGYPPSPEIAATIRGFFSQPESTFGPSLLIDIEDGRATEGEHTIGDLVDRAVQRSVSVPILTAARCALQAHELNRVRAGA